MYPRNRKKRTFFSPGTEEKGKRRREETTDDPEPDSEQAAKDPKYTPTKATPQDKSNTTSENKNTNPSSPPTGKTGYSRSTDDDNKNVHTPSRYKQPRKDGDKDKGSDHDDDDRGVKRKSSKKHSIKQEMDEEGKGSEYEDGDWGSEGEDGNHESGNESGEESPSNGFHEARESLQQDTTSNFDEEEGYEDEYDNNTSSGTTSKRPRTNNINSDQTGNGVPSSHHEQATPSTPPHDPSDESQKPTNQKSTPANLKTTRDALDPYFSGIYNNINNNNNNNQNRPSSSSTLAPSSSSTAATHSSSFSTASTSSSSSSASSSSLADVTQESQSSLSEFSNDKSNIISSPYKKKDNSVTNLTAKTNQQNKAKNQPPPHSHSYPLHTTKNPPGLSLSSEPITNENFRTLFEEMKVEITRLNYRLEEATTIYNARLLEYEEKYVPRAVFNVMEDEVAYLKQQLLSHSSQQLDVHSANGLEKVKHDIGFLRTSIDEVSTDVRQWRMAMDVDLTDKEDRLTQLSLRLDDIERNQQALIIRYPQLMQPAPSSSSASVPSSGSSSGTPAHSPTGPPERLSSSGDKTSTAAATSGVGTSGSGKATSINSIQKDREKHSQSSHSQRMMLPPDIPKYTSTAAPSSPQQTPASSSAPFLSFESSTPSFIQPEPGGWSQSSVYSRQFAQPSAPAGTYFHSSGPNYKPTSSQSSKSHHHMPIDRSTVPSSHDRSHPDSRQHERSHPSHHDRDRLQQERIFQHERLERERLQQERMQDKSSSRPVW